MVSVRLYMSLYGLYKSLYVSICLYNVSIRLYTSLYVSILLNTSLSLSLVCSILCVHEGYRTQESLESLESLK